MNAPLPPPRRPPELKHDLVLSDDDDLNTLAYKVPRKRAKFDNDLDRNKLTAAGEPRLDLHTDERAQRKDKGKARVQDGPPKQDQQGEDPEWYCNSDGELVLVDSPVKKKNHIDQPKASGSKAEETKQGDIGHRVAGRVPPLAFAGGSTKAARVPFDPLDEAVATVCSIIPDVAPTHVRDLLKMPLFGPGKVELVIESLLTHPTYPRKADDPGGRQGKDRSDDNTELEEAMDQDDLDDKVRKDSEVWLDTKQRKALGREYEQAALDQLYCDFPQIQQTNLKRFFTECDHFYAPAYVAARKATRQNEAVRGFKLMPGSKSREAKGKGRAVDALEKEKEWVLKELPGLESIELREARLAKKLEAEIASGSFFECGCCFADTGFSQLIICTEGCQFCRDCAIMNAETQIGMRKYILPCMSTSGCPATFPDSEIVKFLRRKSRDALHKIRQEKEIDSAQLEGLEKCPFCPFACIIENEQERLLHCQRPDCAVISCRQCKKKDHLPKTCQEVTEDAKIDAVHRVEEAMSAALIRKCPKCSEPYIKEKDSCNKITCASCQTLSCYICGEIIPGYEHFRNAGTNAPRGSKAKLHCPLWDDTDRRHFEEIEAARIEAEEVAREQAGITDAELERLKMQAPAPPPARLAHVQAPVVPAYQRRLDRAIAALPARANPGAPVRRDEPARAALARPHVPDPPVVPVVAPPPRPVVAGLLPKLMYNLPQVEATWLRAYRDTYMHDPLYAPHLERWARDAATLAYRDWERAHNLYVAKKQARKERPIQHQGKRRRG
ncbi:E3 ubiquitin-protein ligase RNF216 [Sporobolomyces koalae]|uniref:E3 ubiquitin-protein ligase RNF216 n=1 Tax=Sporobolomyces koalae TaxID=500713 RepID=UPI00316ECBB7